MTAKQNLESQKKFLISFLVKADSLFFLTTLKSIIDNPLNLGGCRKRNFEKKIIEIFNIFIFLVKSKQIYN